MTTDQAGAAPQREPTSEHQPRDVVRHVLGCGPCDGQLDTLKLQGDVLGFLGGRGSAAGETALVEGVLGRAAAVGQRELEDTLYRMGFACLFAVPDVRTSSLVRIETPSAADATVSLTCVGSRLGPQTAGELSVLESAVFPEPNQDSAFQLALRICDLLESVSTRPYLEHLIRGRVFLEQGQHDTAISQFDLAIATGANHALWRDAHINVMRTHIQAGRFKLATEHAHKHQDRLATDRSYWLNLATAHASMGAVEEAHRALDRLRTAPEELDVGEWNRAATMEASWFAKKLGTSEAEAMSALGVPTK
jgi:hypothetical protein